MKKLIAEQFGYDLETVEDVIKVLMKMPKGYTLHPLGQKCQLGLDHRYECVYLEDPNLLGEYTYNAIEEAKDCGYPVEIDVPDEKLETYQNQVYVVMGYSDVRQNGNYEGTLQGVFSTQELAEECGKELVETEVISYYEIECPLVDEFGFK